MIYRNKRDQEAWLREKTLESLKANTFLQENDIVQVAETGKFYQVVSEVTEIVLQNSLYAKSITNGSDKLSTPRNIAVSGAVSGNADFDGSKNITINTTLNEFDASKITSGTIDISRLPQGALERCVVVADDTARFKLTTSQVQQGDTVKVTATNKMYFVIDTAKLSTEAGYTVYTAGTATEVPWSGVTGKPSTFSPSSHTHPATQVTQDATHRFVTDAEKSKWNGKADAHSHPYLPLSGGTLNEGAELKGICGGGTDYWFVRGGGTNDDGYMELGTKDNGNESIFVRQYNTSDAINHSITLMDGNGNQTFNTTKVNGSFTSTGTVTCSDCVTTSDERLKKDIVKIDNALEKVNQLNGYTFLKDGDKQRTTGVLAQELLNVLPEAVFEREDGYYSVSYGNIVGLLIEAIKELQEEVEMLRGDK